MPFASSSREISTWNCTPGCLSSGHGPQVRASWLRVLGGKLRIASTSERIPSRPALMPSLVVLVLVQTSAGPTAQAGCALLPLGTLSFSAPFCGTASRKATSWLERFPQAQRRRRAEARATTLFLLPERIVHS